MLGAKCWVCSALVVVAVAFEIAAREWSDTTGKFRVEAELVDVVDGQVRLKTTAGKVVTVPLAKLSPADQQHIVALQAAKPVSEADRLKADQLTDEAMALFDIDPRGNAALIDRKLREAGKLNPGDIRAEFLCGVYNLLLAADPAKATRNFETCLTRKPGHVPALCNLALCQVKTGKHTTAMKNFEEAAKAAPGLAAITQNLGRAIKVSNDGRIKMPAKTVEAYADLYAGLVASRKFPASRPKLGWLVVNIKSEEIVDTDDDESAGPAATAGDDELPANVVSGGTGFVVKGDYIVTNRHVVGEEKEVLIRDPEQTGPEGVLKAKVVAVSDSADIAVVHCPTLGLPAVEVVAQIPRRGSDVMVLGFPQFSQLGATIKSTRGAITSLPAAQTENMMLLDAEMNSGNSGGPIANKQGQVVAVATAVFKPVGGTGGKYGAGVPIAQNMEFLKQHIPDFAATTKAGAELDWPDVDEHVSRSTVLVLITGELEEAVADAGKTIEGYNDVVLDPTCPGCNGSKQMRGKTGVRCPHCFGLGIDTDVLLRMADFRALIDGEEGTSNTPAPPSVAKLPIPGRLRITSASYGAGGQRADVTDLVRKAVAADPYALIQPDSRSMGDPATGQRKDLAVSFEFNDKPYQFTIADDKAVSLIPVADDGVETADAARTFRIVAARYCIGLTPVDVTRCVADRIIDPAESVCWSALTLEDPWPGPQKRIVVWFDYKGKRYRKEFAEGENQPLLAETRQLVKPVIHRQKVKRDLWYQDRQETRDLGSNDNTFALLAEIAGNFLGGGEQVRITLAKNKQWQVSGNTVQPIAIHAFGVESPLRDKFQAEVEQFEWGMGKPPVKMIHSSEGFCVLSALGGAFNGLGEEARVYINPDDGFWYLTGRAASPINASAVAYRLKNHAEVKLRYAEFSWRPGMPVINMIKENEGFCFLSSIAGDFAGYGEVATIHPNENGHWIFKCTSTKPIHARAYSVRVVP